MHVFDEVRLYLFVPRLLPMHHDDRAACPANLDVDLFPDHTVDFHRAESTGQDGVAEARSYQSQNRGPVLRLLRNPWDDARPGPDIHDLAVQSGPVLARKQKESF